MTGECTNQRDECEGCGRQVCRRCGRCFERVPADPYATMWEHRCPSAWCRMAKRLRISPLRRSDTPRERLCTGGQK